MEIPGSYRLIRRLGGGGMGEVFLARDPRLDRRVAIKRIRSTSTDPEARRRFQREARIAARLNHPSVLQVFDLLSAGDTDFLVMEYVPGSTLRRLLDDGPLPPGRGLRIARQVTEGLAHAHRHDIVHRDLKTENVLITEGGDAKIADFGVAKRLAPATRRGEPTLVTVEGTALGTCRCMSPEQARGEPVDERSDLFSLGVLLYETFTGRSPFKAENDLATLQRVLHHRPATPREVIPTLPDSLSRLLVELLEKEPVLRPRTADEVAERLAEIGGDPEAHGLATSSTGDSTVLPYRVSGSRASEASPYRPRRARAMLRASLVALALTALVFGGRLVWQLVGPTIRTPPPPLSVAVLPAEWELSEAAAGGDEATRAAAEQTAFAVRSALLRGLVGLRGLAPAPFAEIDAVAGTPRTVARAVAADEVLTSRLLCRERTCDLDLDRASASGELLWSARLEVPADNPALTDRAVGYQLRRAYPDHPPRPGQADLAAEPQGYAEVLELSRLFMADPESAPVEATLDRLAALRARSPRFLDAYLLESTVRLYRYSEAQDPQDLEQALTQMEQARRLAPEDPTVRQLHIRGLLTAGRLDAAERELEDLRALIPGDPAALNLQARLLEMRGEPQAALDTMEQAVAIQPSWRHLLNLAALSYRHGRTDDARRHLGTLLERAPGSYDGLSLLAQLELVHGDPARAADLYGDLVERSPGPVELSNLGLAHLLLGQPDPAADAFERAAATAPHNPFFLLNLADARQLQGRDETAAALYRQVLAASEEASDAPQTWQERTVRAQALAHLGDGPAAVEEVQRALQEAPDVAQTAFEASLVYAVVGDRTAALVNARRALSLGFEPRWFELPWFDPLDELPAFRQALGSEGPGSS